MALTVFAEQMGFFHKGSAGIGIAPLDVCLSPPPGRVPIPYTNILFAKDLIKGSKTVRIDGEPTFLENYSETSTSIRWERLEWYIGTIERPPEISDLTHAHARYAA